MFKPLPRPALLSGQFTAAVDFQGPEAKGQWIAGDADIHNRADLLGTLELTTESTDLQLALAAYQKWGEDCPSFLLGEFAFAIWDARARQLFCCCDHMGCRSLVYCTNGSRIAVASDVKTILSMPGVLHELNWLKLATLALPGAEHMLAEQTYHRDILSLAPGTSLLARAGVLRQRRYWQPAIRQDLQRRRPSDTFEELRHLLIQAVRHRARPRQVAVLLSGGLDSSALAALAARHSGTALPLLAFSSVLPEDPSTPWSDEREFIDEFKSWREIKTEYITAPGRGPFDVLDDIPRFEAGPLMTSRQYLFDAFEVAAQASGANLILSGEGGEQGPTTGGRGYLSEMLCAFRWSSLVRELAQAGILHQRSLVQNCKLLARDLLYRNNGSGSLRSPAALLRTRPDTANLKRPSDSHYWRDHRKRQQATIQTYLDSHAFRACERTLQRVRYSYPLRDKNVVEFCLAAPGATKIRNGYSRYLVRGALDGILPPRIQWRTSKQPFSPDYYPRYNAQLPKARDFVATYSKSQHMRELVDFDQLEKCMQPLEPGKKSWDALVTVPYTIYVMCFLLQFPEFKT